MTTQVLTDAVQLTPAAADVVRSLMNEHKLDNGYALRVYVTGRSCSGYQVGMALDDQPSQTDASFEASGIKLLIDEVSFQYMCGATIDYVDDERGKGFMVDNPNALPACSCGGNGCETSEN